jgi:pilus assembly protein FimV
MLRRLSLISLALVGLISSEVWALGLGEIRLDSALNEPLRAEIVLLSATPEELSNLKVSMADGDTFDRYGLDRPAFLSDIEFMIINGVVEVRSRVPISEPFVTFLVDASWSRGRLIREYTILLDPPTFAPQSQPQPAVTAPQRSAPADSGRIEREPTPASQTEPTPASQTQPRQAAPAATRAPASSEPVERQPATDRSVDGAPSDDVSYDSANGDTVVAQRGTTLWGITAQVKPDSRLTMNQTMLAIFEANPDAFGGNINLLRAGSSLRIPSADEIFQIGRGDALSEVQRQHAAWGTGTVDTTPIDRTPQPNLQLVPPDDDVVLDDSATDDAGFDPEFSADPLGREQEIEQRISELEAADVPEQRSLIEIRDNELAALRDELARIRGEVYDPTDDSLVDDELADDAIIDDQLAADDDAAGDDTAVADDTASDPLEAEADDAEPEVNVVTTRADSKPGLVDQILAALTSTYALIGGALVLVLGLLVWFMRRDRDEDEESGAWNALDADEMSGGDLMSATESLRVPDREEESFVVVEQDSAIRPISEDTIEAPVIDQPTDATGSFDSLEDTFSSETAINLDQSDPVAEADFHMAYGLYDQAADLINGALAVEPERQDLLTKLCEIYFVWGNRDVFVDAAGRLKAAIGSEESADWDKIVIMGQQIAADHELFAGAGTAAATRAVDLSFEAGMDETGALDMELGGDDDVDNDVIDLGMGMDETAATADDDGIDFLFDGDATSDNDEIDLNVTQESAVADLESMDSTAEMPTAEAPLAESDLDGTADVPVDLPTDSPTIEQQFDVLGGTAELPSIDEDFAVDDAIKSSGIASDETAEINLDDLGLDISGLDETELASLDDLDATSTNEALSMTGLNEALENLTDVTGKNPEIDPNATGVMRGLSEDDAAKTEVLVDMDFGDVTGTNTLLNLDAGSVEESTDVGLDESLLDATGLTQVLSDDFAVETTSDVDADLASVLSDADATMLASGYGDDETVDAPVDDDETMLAGLDDEDDFDFAKTEALPPDVFTSNANLDDTGELPAVASTDFDLDLDDLTAALKVSEMGDTVDQPRDDATVEQPRPNVSVSADETAETLALAPGDLTEDLHDARTMTEVGTKLDLARAYVDMGDPAGARSILEEVLDEGDDGQRQQAQQLLDSLP